MNRLICKRLAREQAALVLMIALSSVMRPAGAIMPTIGIACTYGPTFTLNTQTGFIHLPDDSTAFMWGIVPAGGAFQHPGPVLCVNEGDPVTVILKNTLAEDVSLVFPGQENVQANGAPAQPQFDTGGQLTSLTDVAPAHGGSVTYSFVAGRPGTYIYESGTQPAKQVRMGLFGALIVRPASQPDHAYHRADSRFDPAEEFMVLLSEIDPYQHQAVANGEDFDLNNYHPRYWLVNGRGFPDTIADNGATWLPTQPYGALARVHPFTAGSASGMIRYLNVGTEDFPFHPHGNNGRVIGRDGYALESSSSEDLSFEKFVVNVGASQTWDVLFRWYDAENYNAAGNPVPVTIPNVANMEFGMFFSGSPYLGTIGPKPPGFSSLNSCGEYYVISHNHALFQITSWGVNMTGPITYMRVDPPSVSCP